MGQPKKPKRRGKRELSKSHSLAAKAKRAELRAKVWDLKVANLSLRRIADALGISRMTAQRYIQQGLRRYERLELQSVRDYRILHHARLDDLAGRLTLIFRKLDLSTEERLATARTLLATWESDRKLLGLDAPQQIINRIQDDSAQDGWEALTDEQLQRKLVELIAAPTPGNGGTPPATPAPAVAPAGGDPQAQGVRPGGGDPDSSEAAAPQ